MKSQLTLISLLLITAIAVIFIPVSRTNGAVIKPAPSTSVEKRPLIEAVFVLDTTGSMSGLIQGAKDKIWTIASTLAQGQPTPEIRMGLVAYRDRGDAYVTQVVDLSSDLDSVYARLMDLKAAGGGDGPESVNQAMHDAVHGMSWSSDSDSYKVVFLVGDAPGHMDYQEVQYPAIVAAANTRGIRINTIQCGDHSGTTQMWQHIAQLNQGEFHKVDQSGGALVINTPFDDQIARLAAALDSTRVYYGDAINRAARQAKIAATAKLNADAPADVLAGRAEFNLSAAGGANLFGDDELVDAVAQGRVDLDRVAPASLPEELRSLSSGARHAYVKETEAKRVKLKQQIVGLTAQRRDYVARERAASPAAAEPSFEDRITSTVAEQAAAKGVVYAEPDKP